MYRLRPGLDLKEPIEITIGYAEIVTRLKNEVIQGNYRKVAIEVHPGINCELILKEIHEQFPDCLVTSTDSLYLPPEYIYREIASDLTEDEVFGRFSHHNFQDFLSPIKVKKLYEELEAISCPHILVGVGASTVISYDCLVYVDITRLEIQNGYKKGYPNWMGLRENHFNQKMKRAYYFEWPASLEVKNKILPQCTYYIDMNDETMPKMMEGYALRQALKSFTTQPFRLVPFFEPGIWGGEWLQKTFQVGIDERNLAWCFDGVPEENSILFRVQDIEVEIPAQNVVSLYPIELLGRKVFGRYGRDFPIRFNYLDTMNGQNLSLQVHPTLDYAFRNFGAKYTQDESYYVMESKEDSMVYIGVKEGVEQEKLVAEFEKSQESGEFDDEKYINQIPVKKHDHLLIPGGTIHSSGKNCVVLEISSTPNRFTFKLWDWGRVDLDGKPRPISIHHGKHVINMGCTEEYARDELYNQIEVIKEEDGLREERTGLHETESIETRRLIFSKPMLQTTDKSVNMLNLVEGEHIQVLSPTHAFEPFDVYYGETFIVPESVGEYILQPIGECVVIKAYIR